MRGCCQGAAARRSSAGAGGSGRSTAGEGCGYPAGPELRNPSRHPGAATCAAGRISPTFVIGAAI